jgi:hypothetical protein
MKRLAILALAASALAPAFAQTSVGVSIGINQPGVYGQIDIGNFPQPRFINTQPILIARPVRYVEQPPVYLYVPPGHQKNWAKHCYRYNACGRPVYFVREDWVRERYEDHRRHDGHNDHDDHDRGNGKGHGKDKHGKGHGRDD